MATNDTCCTIVPYFKVLDGQLDAFKALCERFVERTGGEPQCLYYGFSFDGSDAHCREGYENAEAALAHINNVGDLLEESRKYAEIVRLEIHGPQDELAKLRGPLADLNARFFVLECGFRR
jgi:quinol monooxygenase YgiN